MTSYTPELVQKFLLEIQKEFVSRESFDERDFAKLKNEFSKANGVPNVRNTDLIQCYYALVESKKMKEDAGLLRVISRRKVRSESGVTVITCLTKPMGCPGKCIYCPSEPNMPKSYLSNQPAAMRAVLNRFDPFAQVQNRLASLMATGHNTSKIEIIIIGGTWGALPDSYKEEFMTGIYNGLNQKIEVSEIRQKAEFFEVPKIEQLLNDPLDVAIAKNETSEYRCVGLTVETRPDWVTEKEIIQMRDFGVTRVEMGVQSLDDEVQILTKRGHDIQAVRDATKLLRDSAIKIGYHLMPGLPGSTLEIDMNALRETFSDPDFRPDWLKLYPCMVTKFSDLEEWFNDGRFKPLTEVELIPLLTEMMKVVPRYLRLTRMIRDIPSQSIQGGCKTINLRQIVEQKMAKEGIICEDIRSREIKTASLSADDVELRSLRYKAGDGEEIFLTFDQIKEDKLISLLRLRIPSYHFSGEKPFLSELEGCSFIREVHTYGLLTKIGALDGNSQHFGFGRRLLAEAERITKEEFGMSRIAVIAGVGVREYYKKFGYEKKGTYMVKEL
ncbi:tRNA uridine(34) 5-carboxymethylaminomethyl modification radical SAM/GNAT enzyme Elp3 [Candidatus Peregrinibacteria bacterium]|nr:MAG: tRNA uridine(34) 5-carboxymethylaminomethyl modification radical SAM/GNAT enzyme Elp3 [Candidatus Peregrinibacteria bacterium]